MNKQYLITGATSSLGIYLVKKIMDKVEYKYENLKNIFTISINLQK